MEEIAKLIEMLKGTIKLIAADTELYTDMAQCYRSMHRALVNKGFTRTEAMEIITSIKVGK